MKLLDPFGNPTHSRLFVAWLLLWFFGGFFFTLYQWCFDPSFPIEHLRQFGEFFINSVLSFATSGLLFLLIAGILYVLFGENS